jgi:hypothetical protein
MRKAWRVWGRFSLALLFSSSISLFSSSSAHAAVLIDGFDGTVGQCNWPESSGSNYAAQINAGDTSQVTSISLYFQSPTTADFSGSYTSSMKIYRDNSDTVGTLLGSLPFSSVSGNAAIFNGTVLIPSVGKYWIGMATTNPNSLAACGSSTTPTYSNGWSFAMTSGQYQNGWTQGGVFTYGSHRQMRVVGGASMVALSTPSAPIVSALNGNSINVSETTTTSNASSYVAYVYASDGTTFVDSRTISSITAPTQIGGLTPLSTYKIGVLAVGDGVTYSNSPVSNLTTITMPAISTSISVSANQLLAVFREIDTLTANLTGTNGKVTFYSDGKRIPGCQSVQSAALVAKCQWRPSQRGARRIYAELKTSTAGYLNSTSQILNVQVVSRTKPRI